MAQADVSNSQTGSSSRLSADAVSFVPGKLRVSGLVIPSSSSPGSSSSQKQDDSSVDVQELPHYVTNCYPFVKDDQSNAARGSNSWPGPGRQHHGGQRMPNSHNGPYMYSGARPPGSQNYNGIRHSRPQGYSHRQQLQPGILGSPPQLPGFPPAFMNAIPPHPSASLIPQYYSYQHNMMGVPQPTPAWSNYPDYNPSQPILSPVGVGGGYYPNHTQYIVSSERSESWSGSERGRSSSEPGRSSERGKNKKKKKSESCNMVSIGTQNESGMASLSPKKKSKTKTIILMDAANQTDFSDEIANLTLAEHPNALFKKSKRPRRKSQAVTTADSSTDSADEVDSDSGYSSPLHRRNQISNGTHPAVVPSTLVTSETQPHGLHQSGNNFFLSHAPPQNVNIGLHGYPPLTPHNVNGYPLQINCLPEVITPVVTQAFHSTGMSYAQVIGSSPVSKTNNANCVMKTATKTLSEPQQTSGPSTAKPTVTDSQSQSLQGKKKRRNRRRKRKGQQSDDVGAVSDEALELRKARSSSNVSHASTEQLNKDVVDDTLHFEDEEEFPDLLSASASHNQSGSKQNTNSFSYSDILKTRPSQVNQSAPSTATAENTGSKETKSTRKRRKRREIIDKAADDELKEISLEQEVLKELSMKNTQTAGQSQAKSAAAPSSGGGKKSKQPIALNIAAMIDALEKQQQQDEKSKLQKAEQQLSKWKDAADGPTNVLDSSAPLLKRGKERENPKPKKPSPLKKVILKEREEKKKFRLLDDPAGDVSVDASSDVNMDNIDDSSSVTSSVPPVIPAMDSSDLSQDGSKFSSVELGTSVSADFSPLSQTSPISMSPLSPGESPLSSGVNSPIAGNGNGGGKCGVTFKIHSRRFREYCNQMLDKEIDNCCTLLLQELVRFQDRLYHKDPVKAKMKRRIVLGLREVTKHLKLKKIKIVIISPNLERIQSKGGLDEALNNIICMCSDQDIPFVFALGRRALGRACAKLVPVSVVGVFNYEGTEEVFNRLMELTEKARNAYKEMVQSLENEAEEYSQRAPPSVATGFPTLHAHLGHSRTPSACSAISFTSSILSEPISENYPQSEPETDSKGYEIVKAEEKKTEQTGKLNSDPSQGDQTETSSGKENQTHIMVDNSLNEIDEGHEADTEDLNDLPHSSSKRQTVKKESQVVDDDECDEDDDDDDECDDEESDEEEDDDDDDHIAEDSNDTVEELPHIDSIHTLTLDLQVEILSQHSSTLNLEVMSTHSSKTLGEGSSTVNTEHTLIDRHRHSSGKGEPCESSVEASNKTRPIDKDRIESWIADTQSRMEDLNLEDKVETVSEATLSESEEKVDSQDSASEEILKGTLPESASLEKLNLFACDALDETNEDVKNKISDVIGQEVNNN